MKKAFIVLILGTNLFLSKIALKKLAPNEHSGFLRSIPPLSKTWILVLLVA